MPTVSVIIPAYNSAEYIGQTIESVLAQTYKDFEVIVVDDGSTDNTQEEVRRYEPYVRYIYQTNQERSIARNNGVAASTGEYLVFLDGDDLLLPNKLAVQVPMLDSRRELGLVASGYQFVDQKGNLLREVRPWIHAPVISLETLLFQGLFVIHGVLLRRSWLETFGGFDPSFRGPEDMDLWFRLSLAGCQMDWAPEIVCQYRLHSSNSTRNIQKHYEYYFAVLDNLFARDGLPDKILARRKECYSMLWLSQAGRLYAASCVEAARDCLMAAFQLDSELLSDESKKLSSIIVDWQKSIWVENPEEFINFIFAHLPSDIPNQPSLKKKVCLDIAKSNFYDNIELGDIHSTGRNWLRVLQQDPFWFLNRGGWSLLRKSYYLSVSKWPQNSKPKSRKLPVPSDKH